MDGIILNRGPLHFRYPPSLSPSLSSSPSPSSSLRAPSLSPHLGGLSSPHGVVLGPRSSRRSLWVSAAAGSESVAATDVLLCEWKDEEDRIKAGGSQLLFVQMQALKELNHPSISDQLEPITGQGILDLVVIGCGPAGLALAAESAKAGLSVGMIGPDLPFTNNYGVWEDEFKALGLENCIEHVWKDTAVHLDFNKPFLMGRAYGRVNRYLLHKELLRRCAEAGVKYLDCKVEGIVEDNDSGSIVSCSTGMLVSCRLVTAASGAASGKFLSYEQGGPLLCVQTAYGIEVEVENCPYDPEIMVFMDYRDFKNPSSSSNPMDPPSFLYVMPLSPTRVFFEETCLAARPCLSFDLLKQRLYARLTEMGIKVRHVYEEEWSYIPVGGSIPDTTQQHLGFGAAASMVHPATGYSVVRSLSEAPLYAHAIASALKSDMKNGRVSSESAIPAKMAAIKAWNSLWPNERKRQRAFFLFGLELILKLDLEGTRMFFDTFFKLPDWMWKGFLAAKLTSVDLIWFSFATFLIAPNQLRYHLVRHLIVDASGAYLVECTFASFMMPNNPYRLVILKDLGTFRSRHPEFNATNNLFIDNSLYKEWNYNLDDVKYT